MDNMASMTVRTAAEQDMERGAKRTVCLRAPAARGTPGVTDQGGY